MAAWITRCRSPRVMPPGIRIRRQTGGFVPRSVTFRLTTLVLPGLLNRTVFAMMPAYHCPGIDQGPAGSSRPVPGQRDALHDPTLAGVVVHRVVLRAAIVPDRQRSRRPAESAGEFRTDLVAEQEFQQRRALLLRHAGETNRVRPVDIQRLAPGFGMCAYRRMLGH